MLQPDTKSQILQALKENHYGLTIEDIAKLLKLNRITVTKYVHELLGAQSIHERKIGGYRLLFVKPTHIKEVVDEMLTETLKKKFYHV